MREGGFRNVGGLAHRLASQLTQKGAKGGRGKAGGASIARLRADWPAIVGDELARRTRPEALTAGRSGKTGGKLLRLLVSGAAALEVQHMSGQIVERVNAYAGHRLIDDIRLTQGSFGVRAPSPPPLSRPSPEVAQRVESQVADVKDPELRQALARLGARIAQSGKSGRRSAVIGVLGALLFARGLRAQENLLAPLPGDHILGKAGAPNIIIDYFSLTCPHCANFNVAILPRLKAEAIDKGKAALVLRHYPSDSVATHAAQIAEGAGAAKFFDVVDALFRTQVDWLTSPTPEVEMAKGLASLGITPDQARGYIGNDQLLDKIVADVETGQTLKVRATPTLFINGQFYGSPPGGAEGADAILRRLGL